MKNKALLFLSIGFAAIIGLSSCNKDENLAPKLKSAVLSSDNKTITVTFSEAVYSNVDKTGALAQSNLLVTAPAGVTFTYTVTHEAGATTATVNLTITSIIKSTDFFTIKPASATSIYDVEGLAMEIGETIDSNTAAQDLGIIGKWISEGTNVSTLFAGSYFNIKKVEAEFKANFTYVVNQFNNGNTTTTPNIVFTGTYVIAKSAVSNIWTITCSQELPYTATASGIFEIKTGPEVLWYEVVQTSGTQNVPPTPALGFGSSNGGTLSTWNIQKYVRVP